MSCCDIDGNQVSGDIFSGHRLTMLNIWATYCGPCTSEMPDLQSLNGQYASFGKVIEGLDVVDAIADVDTDRYDRPLKEQKMKKVTVETFGEKYPEPKTLRA